MREYGTASTGQSTGVTRTPQEALDAIRKLCDSTIWILSAKDIRPILDSVRPPDGDSSPSP